MSSMSLYVHVCMLGLYTKQEVLLCKQFSPVPLWLIDRSIKQRDCCVEDDGLILGNLLPWVPLGMPLLIEPVS